MDLSEIKKAIDALSEQELCDLVAWLQNYSAGARDRKKQEGVHSGKFDSRVRESDDEYVPTGYHMKHEFRVIYTPIEDGWIMAQAPELPGAVTQGKTIEEAREMIKEAVELLLASYRENAEREAPGNAIREILVVNSPTS